MCAVYAVVFVCANFKQNCTHVSQHTAILLRVEMDAYPRGSLPLPVIK